MKSYIIGLLYVLLIATSVNGQSKKELETQVAQLQTQLDSVNAKYSSLSTVHDSTSKVLDAYLSMHKTIEEKLMLPEFKPEDIGAIIDSLKGVRKSSFANLNAEKASLSDTITLMSTSIVGLNAQIDSQKAEIAKLNADIEKLSVPFPSGITDEQVAALEKLKKLLDAKILTQAEFDAKKQEILGN